jgi:hypothetical protein
MEKVSQGFSFSAVRDQLVQRCTASIGIEPLITFRILFGGLLFFGTLRFLSAGWIEKLYVEPPFFFKYYGFHWVENLPPNGMYGLYILVALSALGIALGLFYRWSVLFFLLSFSYAQLIDLTNYLNHYYLVILLAFLLLFLPANRAFSLDTWRKPALKRSHIPAWCIYILMLQIGLVYFYAGLAKLNPDWLFQAMPLAVWLPTKADFPLLGPLFEQYWVAFAFSWFGALYDLSITFFLLNRRTRPWAYVAVIIFHLLTKLLFNIGLFPLIMIFNTLIFFSPSFHQRLLSFLGYRPLASAKKYTLPRFENSVFKTVLTAYFIFQLLLPLRHLYYPGPILWTEEGYRFSWRVMLIEKSGTATFTVKDTKSKRQSEVINANHLTPFQEKQMAIQADFILQYAHYLADYYQKNYGFVSPIVTVQSHVALNGRSSKSFVAPQIDLTKIRDDWSPKKWILK